jgi:hypothetical protein
LKRAGQTRERERERDRTINNTAYKHRQARKTDKRDRGSLEREREARNTWKGGLDLGSREETRHREQRRKIDGDDLMTKTRPFINNNNNNNKVAEFSFSISRLTVQLHL